MGYKKLTHSGGHKNSSQASQDILENHARVITCYASIVVRVAIILLSVYFFAHFFLGI